MDEHLPVGKATWWVFPQHDHHFYDVEVPLVQQLVLGLVEHQPSSWAALIQYMHERIADERKRAGRT